MYTPVSLVKLRNYQGYTYIPRLLVKRSGRASVFYK